MNKVWLFGETSEFSQSILTQLKKKSNDIQTFGRRNISYDLSEEDFKIYQLNKLNEEKKEKERLQRLKDFEEVSFNNYDKIHQQMIGR